VVTPAGKRKAVAHLVDAHGMSERRACKAIVVSDNGSELTSNAILTWADHSRAEWHCIAPGKPMQNAFIASMGG
jgi:transposase InsO family protein